MDLSLIFVFAHINNIECSPIHIGIENGSIC